MPYQPRKLLENHGYTISNVAVQIPIIALLGTAVVPRLSLRYLSKAPALVLVASLSCYLFAVELSPRLLLRLEG